jgi:hypothetical protein
LKIVGKIFAGYLFFAYLCIRFRLKKEVLALKESSLKDLHKTEK